MTKYILNSGGLRAKPDKAKHFFKEMIKDKGEDPKILYCFFAQKRENWEEKYSEYIKDFLEKIDGAAKPTFDLAFPDKFIGQVSNADIINIHGGDDHLLQYWLSKFDLKEIFKDKVVATNSAGSDALVQSFWTCDWRQCINGLGVLPIKFIPHYKSNWGNDDPRGPIDWEKAHQELAEYGDKNLPIYALEEADFVVFEQ